MGFAAMCSLSSKNTSRRASARAASSARESSDTSRKKSGMRFRKHASGPNGRGCMRPSATNRACSAAAAFLYCLYSSRRSTSMSRASEGASSAMSSSTSMCSRGSRLCALISSSVLATNRKSLATSRSRFCMRPTSARYWSAICVILMAPMSTFWRLTRYNSRSNGPSKLSVRTRYDTMPRRPYEMVKGNSRLPRLPAVTSR